MSLDNSAGGNASGLFSSPIPSGADYTIAFFTKRSPTLYTGAIGFLCSLVDEVTLAGDDNYVTVSVDSSDRVFSKAKNSLQSDFFAPVPSEEMDNVWSLCMLTCRKVDATTYETILRFGNQIVVYPFGVRWVNQDKNGVVIGDKRSTQTSPSKCLTAHWGSWVNTILGQNHFDQAKVGIPLDTIDTTDLSGTSSNVPMHEYFKLGADLQSEVSATVLTHSGTAAFSADNPFIDTSLPVTYTQVGNVGIVMVNNTRAVVKAAPLETSMFLTDLGGYGYLRSGTQVSIDYDGVLTPNDDNDFGLTGSRRVKNIFLNSEDAALWNSLGDGDSSASVAIATNGGQNISVLEIHNTATQQGGPFIYNDISVELEPHLFSSRALVKQTVGAKDLSWQGRTFGNTIGSESNGIAFTPSTSSFEVISQTMQQFERHLSDVMRPVGKIDGASTLQVGQMQFEDVSGFKVGKEFCQEYVPSSNLPGIKWFGTNRADTRENPATTYGHIVNDSLYGGKITEATGAALTGMKGILCEPASTNLCKNYNDLSNIATAVLDGVSTNFSSAVPATSSRNTIYIDPRSERLCFNETDISLTDGGAGTDSFDSVSTDFVALGFRVGMSVWVNGSATGSEGVFTLTAVTSNQLQIPTGSLASAQTSGQVINIARCPAVGNNIIVVLNDDTAHYTTVTGVSLPAVYGDHGALEITLSVNPPSDGGFAGSNNNRPVYYYNNSDLGITAGNTGVVSIRYMFNDMVQEGLGSILRKGLVYEISTPVSSDTFSFENDNTNNLDHSLSAFTKLEAGASYQLKMSSHGGTVFTNTSWDRVKVHGKDTFAGGFKMQFSMGGSSTLLFALNQLEENSAYSTTSSTAGVSSVIVTKGATEIRGGTIINKLYGLSVVNDFKVNLTYTPQWPDVDQEQCLYSVFEDAINFTKLSLVNSTLTLTKSIAGVVQTASQTLVPVVGTSYVIEYEFNSTTGFSVTVDAAQGTVNPDTNDLPITATSTAYIGSFNGTFTPCGSIFGLIVDSL